MAQTVADYLLARLVAWDVRRIFGYPGDGINGIIGALGRADGKPEFVQVRHEEMAAFMATALAKFTGEVGVCLATSGPGAIHLLNGLYDALLDHQPVVAIVGQQHRAALGGHYQQEVDLTVLFKDVASAYVQMVTTPAQMRHVIDSAMRTAAGERALITVAKYWRGWRDPRFVVMVLNNGDLNQVTWEQRAMSGDPKFSGSQDLPLVPFARFAELLGLQGIAVDAPDAIGPAWDRALASDRPTLLDVRADPNVPPLPPHVSLKLARAYAEALLKGDPDTAAIVRRSLAQIFA